MCVSVCLCMRVLSIAKGCVISLFYQVKKEDVQVIGLLGKNWMSNVRKRGI